MFSQDLKIFSRSQDLENLEALKISRFSQDLEILIKESIVGMHLLLGKVKVR